MSTRSLRRFQPRLEGLEARLALSLSPSANTYGLTPPANTIGIVSGAANPHAAALFVDYNLSKEANEIMVKNQGRWTPRKDVPWTVEPRAELHVVSALEWGKKLKPLVELFRKTVGQ